MIKSSLGLPGVPLLLTTALPLLALPTMVTVRESPSISMSLPKTLILTAISSLLMALSSAASGGSLTGLMVRLTVAVSIPPFPSFT